MKNGVLAALALTFLVAPSASSQSILTVVGGGRADGHPATTVSLEQIDGLAIDEEGNLYLAEPYADRVSRIDAKSGILTRVAGDGARGFSGDGGPATEASLDSPGILEIGPGGDLFIVDRANNAIRRFDPSTGTIHSSYDGGTHAGGFWVRGISSDTEGNLYFTTVWWKYYVCRVHRLDADTGALTTVAGAGCDESYGDGGPAEQAALRFPEETAIDREGHLYVAEAGKIRRIDATTRIITTVAGTGEIGFGGDGGLAVDALLGSSLAIAYHPAGALYIADRENHRIRRLDLGTGLMATVAGNGIAAVAGDGGAALDASLLSPSRVRLAPSGDLYVADGDRVRKIDMDTGIIDTVAGGGEPPAQTPAKEMQLGFPSAVAVDAFGNLYIADTNPHVVWRLDSYSGMVTRYAGAGEPAFSGDGGPAVDADLDNPADLVIDREGNLFISDLGNQRVRRVDGATGIITTVAGSGDYRFSGDGGPATAAGLSPAGIGIDSRGNLFIADTYSDRVRRVDRLTGTITTVAGRDFVVGSGDGVGGPATDAYLPGLLAVALDAGDHLFIAQNGLTGNGLVRRVDAATGILTSVAGSESWPGCGLESECAPAAGDGGPATEAQIYGPWAIDLDRNGGLYFTNWNAGFCLSSNCEYPHPPWDFRVRKVDGSSGVVSTVAGRTTSSPGGLQDVRFAGDGGPANQALLNQPRDVAWFDGDLYIADQRNRRIRVVRACSAPARPGLVSPADGSRLDETSVRLTWGIEDDAWSYDVYLGEENSPMERVATVVAEGSFVVSGLSPGKSYTWKILATGDPHCEPRLQADSSVWSFSIRQPRHRPVRRP